GVEKGGTLDLELHVGAGQAEGSRAASCVPAGQAGRRRGPDRGRRALPGGRGRRVGDTLVRPVPRGGRRPVPGGRGGARDRPDTPTQTSGPRGRVRRAGRGVHPRVTGPWVSGSPPCGAVAGRVGRPGRGRARPPAPAGSRP